MWATLHTLCLPQRFAYTSSLLNLSAESKKLDMSPNKMNVLMSQQMSVQCVLEGFITAFALHQRRCKTCPADGRVSSERNCQSSFTMDRKMVFRFCPTERSATR